MRRLFPPVNYLRTLTALAPLLILPLSVWLPARVLAQAPQPRTFTTTQSISDEAQRTTLAFAALGMITGNLEAQSFFPPGKVADYTGFQYLRDNDPDDMGHNTSFLTRVANNVIYILNDDQFSQLKTLATAQLDEINLYGYKRFALMKAFRRLLDGDVPSGSTGLSLSAVKQASRELYLLDGRISFDRALLYANVLGSMDSAQKAYLDAMRGKGWKSWPDITDAQIRSRMAGLPQGTAVAVMTYAGDLFSWYAGSVDADVYFCPERHGTYFGSFYIKDAPAVGHEGYSIDEQLTATAGAALSDSSLGYVTQSQAALVSGLVDTQRNNLYAGSPNIVLVRTQIATLLRGLIASTAGSDAIRTQVLELSGTYGDLDGENNYAYATVFAQAYRTLTTEQTLKLAALRESIMSGVYSDGTTYNYSLCATPFLYSSAITDRTILDPYIGDTDYLFSVDAPVVVPSTEPTIASFAAAPTNIQSGGQATLSWSVTGAETVTIDNGIGGVLNTAARTVAPTQTTTYTLTASASGCSTSAKVTVTVTSTPSTATPTIGLIAHDETRASPGYTLLAPKHYKRTYLIDNYGQVVNAWDSGYEPGQSAHLLPNGHLLRAGMMQVAGGGTGGGEGGRIEEYDWEGNLVWGFDYATQERALHHDIKPLPNGNVIALMVERKSREQAIAAGVRADLLQDTYLLPDAVVEIEPVRPSGGRIVWEWHVWDHLVQNADTTKANYGTPSAHPELVDPNASGKKIPAFWNHMNSIDYNPALDQIALSVRGNSEIWIIDHSTTTAEAASHTGGKYGKGGDLLYRWGNPQMYGRGAASSEMLFQQHDAQWIEPGSPGAGNMLVFNNGLSRPAGQFSSADEFAPPIDGDGNYLIAAGSPYGPNALTWTYAGIHGTEFYAEAISGAHRQRNGNTLICYGTRGVLVEVTPAGEVVWLYVDPVVKEGPLTQGQTSGLDDRGHNWNAVFKVRRYPPDYAGLAGRDLTPKGVIELSDASTTPVTPTAPGSSKYPEMALIPAGEFQMGDHAGFVDPQHPSDELPIHNVSLDSFYIGVYDVTNTQYLAFLNSAYAQGLVEVREGIVYRKGSADVYCDTAQSADYSSIGWDGSTFALADTRGTHPVVGVRWSGAAAYANWLSSQLGLDASYDTATWSCDFSKNGYRLPTEAEWEYAARGGQDNPYYVYPWGDDADPARANWPIDAGNPYRTGAYPWTTPAGFYNGTLRNKAEFAWPGSQSTYQTRNGSNAFGLYDMAGNVWQWVNDWYGTDYYSASPASNPKGPDTGTPMPDGLPYHGMRGGNWYNGDQTDPGHARVSNRDPGYYRGPQDPSHPYYHVGFRVARPATGALSPVSAASFSAGSIAPDSLVSAFGSGLAGDAVVVKDSNGIERTAQGLFSSAEQLNFIVPEATAMGKATVTLLSSGAPIASGSVLVEKLAPGLFSANADGKGVAAAVAVIVAADGSQTAQVVFDVTAPVGTRRGTPIDVSRAGENVYLMLFGTGMRNTTQTATATIGGWEVAALGPVAQGQVPGLDQVNLGPLPPALSGRGEVEIALSVEGKPANKVTVTIR